MYYLEEGFKTNDNRPDLLNNYGLALFNNDNIDKAEVILIRCLNIDNANFKAFNNLGNVFRRQQKPNEAIEMYKKSIETSQGSHLPAYINLASTYLQKNDLFSCIENIENALKVKPKDSKRALQV